MSQRDEIAHVIAVTADLRGGPIEQDYRRADALVAAGLLVPPDEARFAPMGDNHHNAAACPYCSPNLPKPLPPGLTAEKLRAIAGLLATAQRSVPLLSRANYELATEPGCDDLLDWASFLDTQETPDMSERPLCPECSRGRHSACSVDFSSATKLSCWCKFCKAYLDANGPFAQIPNEADIPLDTQETR